MNAYELMLGKNNTHNVLRDGVWIGNILASDSAATAMVAQMNSAAEKDKCIQSLIAACRKAFSALDGLMGDSDLLNDDSKEMEACQAISAVLRDYENKP